MDYYSDPFEAKGLSGDFGVAVECITAGASLSFRVEHWVPEEQEWQTPAGCEVVSPGITSVRAEDLRRWLRMAAAGRGLGDIAFRFLPPRWD